MRAEHRAATRVERELESPVLRRRPVPPRQEDDPLLDLAAILPRSQRLISQHPLPPPEQPAEPQALLNDAFGELADNPIGNIAVPRQLAPQIQWRQTSRTSRKALAVYREKDIRGRPKVIEKSNLKAMQYECQHCRALHWISERRDGSNQTNPRFSTCCQDGQVSEALHGNWCQGLTIHN